jgi:histidinol-phosphate aminotransferase
VSPARPRAGLRDIEPYQAPQLDVPVRLNTNECPYPLPEGFVDDLADAVRTIEYNRYPDRELARLREAIGEHAGHPLDGTWAASGSNEVLLQLMQAYAGPGRSIVTFDPTYELFGRLAWTTHTHLEHVELEEPWAIGPEHVDRARLSNPSVAIVCSPNNPTGNAHSPGVVADLADALPDCLVIVDEAYIEFGGESALPLTLPRPNVAIVRTMSKAFALAGARLGYCLANEQIVDDLRRVRLPYHVSALGEAAGYTALQHSADALAILKAVREQRDRISEALARLPGVHAYPSDANFVMFRPSVGAADTWRALLDRGVLVRDVSKVAPGCLRVTAGTPEEVDAFLGAMEEVV